VIFLKKTAAILLATIYLLSATETGELLKIPLLAAHYYVHKGEDSNIGITAFLIQHYCTEDGTDSDTAEDRQLPFKSAEQFSTALFVSPVPPSHLIISRPETSYNHTFVTRDESLLPIFYLASIWQPPRIS